MKKKKVLSFLLAALMVSSIFTVGASATNEDGINPASTSNIEEQDLTFEALETIIYATPRSASVPTEDTQTLLISAEEIAEMSEEELVVALLEKTPLNEDQASVMSAQLKNGNPLTRYGIYDFPEWYISPYVTSSTYYVTYSDYAWMGIDAYRSSVGMTKGQSETKTISFSLGFTGSGEIKKVKTSLTANFTHSNSYTVSATQNCPAWTTMNWRPYSTFWQDEWYGKMKITTIIPYLGGVYENVWYEEHTGTNKTLALDTHEVWSRVNSAKNVNAPTPYPDRGAPGTI